MTRTHSNVVTIAWLAVVFLLGVGSSASAVPLSSRPTGPGIHYFGYINSALENWGDPIDGCPGGDYTACIVDHSNSARAGSRFPITWVD